MNKLAQLGVQACNGLYQHLSFISPLLSVFLPSLTVSQALHLSSFRLVDDLQILGILFGSLVFEEVDLLLKVFDLQL